MTNYRNRKVDSARYDAVQKYLENMVNNAAKHGIELGVVVFRIRDADHDGRMAGAAIATQDAFYCPSFYNEQLDIIKGKLGKFTEDVAKIIDDLDDD